MAGQDNEGEEKKYTCYNGTRCLRRVLETKLVRLYLILETIRKDRKSRILGENSVQN